MLVLLLLLLLQVLLLLLLLLLLLRLSLGLLRLSEAGLLGLSPVLLERVEELLVRLRER